MDREQWPALKERVAGIIKQKTRDEWCAIMDGTDICFAPVLSLAEAPKHPHNAARQRGQLHDPAPEPHELFADFLRRATHRGANLHDRLMQLRLHLPEEAMIVLQQLRDVRLQLPGDGVDYLILFLDSDCETRSFHRPDSGGGMWDVGSETSVFRSASRPRFEHREQERHEPRCPGTTRGDLPA